jgi:phosphoglucosamine mutase
MARLFGTDGVRGIAGSELTAGLAMDLAAAAAGVLVGTGAFAPVGRAAEGQPVAGQPAVSPPAPGARRPVAVVGRDPRASGEFLEAAVVAGLAASGVDVLRLGVVPTPAVAYLTPELGADFGVMLSASHNPAPDNGIKFFARGGVKLPDAVEDELEARLASAGPAPGPRGPHGPHGPRGVPAAGFGRVSEAADAAERYLDYLLSTLPPGQPLRGLRIVVDCAHGSASAFAPRLLRRAGAQVITIGADPDGLNINDGCGSTHLEVLAAAVLEHHADAGIAHDGDADRCLAVDASGAIVDGDQILAVLALALRDAGRLAGDTVVATVMSNLGFRLAMRQAGISVVETPVGDRYLVAAMLDGKYTLGGEQSGHVIMLDHATTGDGMLTALHLLAQMAAQDVPLAGLTAVMTRYPQVLLNIRDVDKARAAAAPSVAAAVAAAEAELGDSGRVLVRPSGTEPAVRVMVEAKDRDQAHRVATQLAQVVRALD